MGKYFIPIALIIVCSICYSQPADINIIVGAPGTEDDTLDIGIGGWQEIPVYIQSNSPNTMYIGYLHYALGINNGYLEEFDTTSITIEYPLSEFIIQAWGYLNEDWYIDGVENTWDSFSFIGSRDAVDPHLFLMPGADPQHILTFFCRTPYDPSLADITIPDALGPGFDPIMQGTFEIYDSTVSVEYNIEDYYSNVRFFKYDGLITGTVLNVYDEPIENVNIESENSIHYTSTDEFGEFSLISLSDEFYSLQLSHPEHDFTNYIVSMPMNDTVDIEITMQKRGAIRGVVDDSDGLPIEGAVVTINGLGFSDTTNANGEFILPYLLSDFYELTYSADNYLTSERQNIRVHSPDTAMANITLAQCEIEFIDDQVKIWAGGSFNGCQWNDTMIVYPGQWLELPIYMFGDYDEVAIGQFGYPLGFNNAYIDQIDTVYEEFSYPISAWDINYFNWLNEDWQIDSLGNTWDSYTCLGICASSPPYDNPHLVFEPGSAPKHLFTYRIHFRDDLQLSDTIITDAIGTGMDPYMLEGGVGDTTGVFYYTVTRYYCAFSFSPALAYLPGDINMAVGYWPPHPGLSDVTYLVNYFRAMPSSVPCFLDGFWASADVNGDCQIIGSDVTFMVNYFRGLNELFFCQDYAPIWINAGDVPTERLAGWPYCEE